MHRVRGCSRGHAIDQLKAIADVADFKENWTGAEVAFVGDLKLFRDGDTIVTVAMR